MAHDNEARCQLSDARAAALLPLWSLVAGAVLVSAGCGGSTHGASALKPIDQAAVEASVDASARDLLVPGAVVLLRTPQGEFTATYGSVERGSAEPPGPDSHFRIGSVTKSMTAAVILQLAQEGALHLDDPVAKYRPHVPDGARIAISQLLNMHSGLYNYTADPDFWPTLDGNRTRQWTPDELLAIAFRHESHDPGPYDYCNTNTVLLGLIAEQLDHKPLSQVFRDRLFVPLGMIETMLPDAQSTTIPEPRARGYVYDSIIHVFLPVPYSPEIEAAARAGTLAPIDFTDLNPTWAWAAGGVVSTARDLATWIEALVGGELLNAKYQRIWRESLRPIDRGQANGQQYGYGIVRLSVGPNRIFFHNGELPGYNTFAGYDPVNRVTMVGWASLPVAVDNRSPEGPAERIIGNLAAHVYQAAPSTVDPDIPGD
ncbi:MAG TPA: serine hydrolase domain-containing protein [Candidatus Dormibacteraeota bacterium]|nr:serine hydrolase domain-containing protein [Candidatus Dormibacteraeota bacterium]